MQADLDGGIADCLLGNAKIDLFGVLCCEL
jgi:hypothetical protein